MPKSRSKGRAASGPVDGVKRRRGRPRSSARQVPVPAPDGSASSSGVPRDTVSVASTSVPLDSVGLDSGISNDSQLATPSPIGLPGGGASPTLELDGNVSCVVTTNKPGVLLVTESNRFLSLDWEGGVATPIAEVDQDRPENYFNDGKCDARGRLWAGTFGPLETNTKGKFKQGSLYCLDVDRFVTKHIDGVEISNGLCWSHCNKTMYYIDTPSSRVDAFDYCLETGTLSNRRTVIEIPKEDGYPDGMTIDTEGMVWVACFDGSSVNRYNPQTGEKLQTVDLPCTGVTSCCFGGKNLDTLYVTTSKDGLNEQKQQEQPLAGSLFKVTGLGFKGRPAYQYAG